MSEVKQRKKWYVPVSLAERANQGFLCVIRSTGTALRHVKHGTISGVSKVKGLCKVKNLFKRDAGSRAEPAEAPGEDFFLVARDEMPNEHSLLDRALDEAVVLTGSSFGYIYQYDEEARRLTLNTWSKSVMKECASAHPQIVYEYEQTGAWGEALQQGKPIVINDFAAPNPLKQGLPTGPTPVRRFMTVPVPRDGKVVAVVCVANKEAEYTSVDVQRLTHLVGSVWGLVDRHRIEADLQNEVAKLGMALRAAQMGTWHLDISIMHLYFDTETCRSLGLDPAKFTGSEAEFFAVVHPDDRARLAAAVRRTLETGAPYEAEYRVVWPDGSVHDIAARGAVAYNHLGRPSRFNGVNWDISERKRAEEGNERFRVGFERGAVAQALVSLDFHFLQVNEALSRLLQFPRAELEGKSFDEVTHPDDRGAGPRVLDALLAGEESFRFEKRYLARNGATVWVDVNVALVRDSNGRPQHFVGTYVDITEHRRVEAELCESRRRLDLALQAAKMGVWHWDLLSDLLGFDDQICALLGIDRATFFGKADEFFRVVHPDDHEKIRAVQALTISNDAPYQVDFRVVWQDGSLHHIAVRGGLVRDKTGKPVRIDGVLWDQTERACAGQALRESEERFRQIVEVFPQSIFEADLSGRIYYSNQHGIDTFGATQAELEEGINLVDTVSAADRPKVQERMRERLEGKPGRFIEFRALRRNGEMFDALAYSSPIFAQGRVVGIRGFVLDISERRQAEEKLREASQLLKSATTH